jgi:hypothetical protein
VPAQAAQPAGTTPPPSPPSNGPGCVPRSRTASATIASAASNGCRRRHG